MNNPLSIYTLQCRWPLRQGGYRVSEPGLGVLTPAPAPSEARAGRRVTQSWRHGGHAERDSVIKLPTSEKLKHKVTKNYKENH